VQIITWGGSFYLMAVLVGPVVKDTGWDQQWVYGALSLGLLVSGCLSPLVGRLISRHGGRNILCGSGLILAVGLVAAALAPNLPCFVLAWAVIGIGMAVGLYDPLFATLGQLYGSNARGAITQATLVSGFCTTIIWSTMALLIEHVGWREACLLYSILLAVVVLPIYRYALPRHAPQTSETKRAFTTEVGIIRPQGRIYLLLAVSFTLAAVIMTAMSVQLITLLQSQGISLVAAIGIAAMIGPSQVGARFLEVLFARNSHPIWSTLISTLLVGVGLLIVYGSPTLAAVGVVVYGIGNGIRSIVRGTLPLALFGAQVFPVVLGRIARPTIIAQALTPVAGGYLQAHFGSSLTLVSLTALGIVNALVVVMLTVEVRKERFGARLGTQLKK
jgi:MFS family permease